MSSAIKISRFGAAFAGKIVQAKRTVKSVFTNQSGRLDEPTLPDRSDLKTVSPAFDEIGKYSQDFWRKNGCQPSRPLLPGAIGGAFPGLQVAEGLPSQHEGQSHDAAQVGGIVPARARGVWELSYQSQIGCGELF
ncbi:hypothetical protein N9060_02180 [Arenicella sp.]|nr:hypothetical protein [Arenicella sp.]